MRAWRTSSSGSSSAFRAAPCVAPRRVLRRLGVGRRRRQGRQPGADQRAIRADRVPIDAPALDTSPLALSRRRPLAAPAPLAPRRCSCAWYATTQPRGSRVRPTPRPSPSGPPAVSRARPAPSGFAARTRSTSQPRVETSRRRPRASSCACRRGRALAPPHRGPGWGRCPTRPPPAPDRFLG